MDSELPLCRPAFQGVREPSCGLFWALHLSLEVDGMNVGPGVGDWDLSSGETGRFVIGGLVF